MSITEGFRDIPLDRLIDQRTITAVQLAEDGWNIEVEDVRGVRLTYLIPDTGYVPRIGDTAQFYGGIAGHPIYGLDINGTPIFHSS